MSLEFLRIKESVDQTEKGNVSPLSKVVSLFEEFRDTNFLRWSDVAPAKINREKTDEVSIEFNATPYCECSEIKIRALDNNGTLGLINNRFKYVDGIWEEKITIIEKGELEEVIAQQIASSNLKLREIENQYKKDKELIY